ISVYFPPFISDFLAIFAWITIFGNMHRPCKQYPNITNSECHEKTVPEKPSFFLKPGPQIPVTLVGNVLAI
ncbi:hypothetical protein K443DRAFT_95050, partial [Laccaria amethystina LaAM-08-1]